MSDVEPWFLPRLESSAFGVLATHGPASRIDQVPCCFAVIGSGSGVDVVTAVDHKPKRTARLARLDNVERNPAASLLVDHRDPDDWTQLWWVRTIGSARVVTDGDSWSSAIDALVDKYAQYREQRPAGPVIRLTVDRWAGWRARVW